MLANKIVFASGTGGGGSGNNTDTSLTTSVYTGSEAEANYALMITGQSAIRSANGDSYVLQVFRGGTNRTSTGTVIQNNNNTILHKKHF